MTLLQWYVLVGAPLILLAGAYGAVCLAKHDRRNADRHIGPAE
ncbi:hypothetical protein [Ancylobacter oerskovii]|uniref:Uncharacterized protein n=1 Tax=Ancylobacter oerskovii TaxID=459519 RepID=A0ABW4YT22_9HYPH|nr:hypothetical protein [Ancylobacter oerskovii]